MKNYKDEGPPVFDEFPSYKGGCTRVYGGYVWEFCPGHRLQNQWGWVAQHRLVAEDMIGRPLIQSDDESIAEVVHHKDECRSNNDPSNLQVMTHRAHRAHHARQLAIARRSRLTEDKVRVALEGRTIKQAAEHLRINHQTIRNRFPHLIEHLKRKSPSDLEDPELIAEVRRLAADKHVSRHDAVKVLKIGPQTLTKICETNGIDWRKKTREGNIRRHYRGRPTPRWLAANASATEPAAQ